ncbi:MULTISPECIES: dTDP-glucose 4,6-dehydratase [Methanoculleus]|uniref:dTDP-glucose 4,6-dehydratase n=2 Tax=Methanoculleus TaxID=45989 RepID=A3CRX0_METMJ|nr:MULTISPECIES: dTDP-glucose 4,6-dehydratase [Methanoculleus]ABN56120.1 dTDP-glucose 4,6-dehydratase [Methanoculleus marisnigri JR1]UYU17595.1 dTDP-glucose 4,6-dehydratase [Methanoculleus submarinus]
MRILVTGGLGFIGSNFIRQMLEEHPGDSIVNLDKITYAGNPENLKDIAGDPRYTFVRGDICDPGVVGSVFREHPIDAVVHFAAESHVDRSIEDASVFVRTNVLGTHVLLEAALSHGVGRFIHVSTDEVYGSIKSGSFRETDNLNPSSPYSASKAASDLLARSYYITHNLPVIVTRCTNNFGPYQYPEKLIPLFATNLLEGKKVPVYGTGKNVRDWIHVADHCRAVDFVLRHGEPGEVYNIGGDNEKSNLEITEGILRAVGKDESMVEYVPDRLGHDWRYSLDSSKLRAMGWKPEFDFETALRATVQWYTENEWWWRPLKR